MRRGRVIDQCTNWLNHLLRLSPDLVAYKIKFEQERRMWTFEMYIRSGEFFMYNIAEHTIERDTYEDFKKRLGELFR